MRNEPWLHPPEYSSRGRSDAVLDAWATTQRTRGIERKASDAPPFILVRPSEADACIASILVRSSSGPVRVTVDRGRREVKPPTGPELYTGGVAGPSDTVSITTTNLAGAAANHAFSIAVYC